MLSAADLDGACTPLLAQLRARRVVSDAQLAEVVPTDHSDDYAWLSCYGQLRVWLAGGVPKDDDQAAADALVTSALRDVPIPVDGVEGLFVYPKSLEGMLQIMVLDAQLDRLVARLVAAIGEDASLLEVDTGVQLVNSVSYAMQLLAWAWTSEGYGLPFKASDPVPTVPEPITALGPEELLAITRAAHEFGARLAACQTLIDPTPVRNGGKRPSWAAFFEALGAQTHIDARELAVSHTLTKVLSLAYLASDRQRPRTDEDSR
jgi:hypothetical protein